jgi:hypothetical protein
MAEHETEPQDQDAADDVMADKIMGEAVDTLTLVPGTVLTVRWMGDESMASITVRVTGLQESPLTMITGSQQ